MDLAIGAKQTWVMMDLLTKKGESKVRGEVQLPAHRHSLRQAHLLRPRYAGVHARRA